MQNCKSRGGDKPGVSPNLVLQVDQVGLDLFERGNLSLHHFVECWRVYLLDAQLLSLDFFRLPAAPSLSLSLLFSGALGAGPQTSSIHGSWRSLADRHAAQDSRRHCAKQFIPSNTHATEHVEPRPRMVHVCHGFEESCSTISQKILTPALLGGCIMPVHP
jgi:hypothetical protein